MVVHVRVLNLMSYIAGVVQDQGNFSVIALPLVWYTLVTDNIYA